MLEVFIFTFMLAFIIYAACTDKESGLSRFAKTVKLTTLFTLGVSLLGMVAVFLINNL